MTNVYAIIYYHIIVFFKKFLLLKLSLFDIIALISRNSEINFYKIHKRKVNNQVGKRCSLL